jgi:hypothetical protein
MIEKRMIKQRDGTCIAGYFEDGVRINRPLTVHEKAQLKKAEQVMRQVEAETPNRRALAALELHENAAISRKLQKELEELKYKYKELLTKYDAAIKEGVQLAIQVQKYKHFPFLSWLLSFFGDTNND